MAPTELQSDDQRDLLDIIDKLRSARFGRYVDLPEIIVCGDQSSGKSSVLNAVSEMSFPAKDNLCTRFATELILRRDTTMGIKISIIAGPERSQEERDRLSDFHVDMNVTNPDIEPVIEQAKAVMGISEAKRFSTDILRIELSGPNQPHLTMVDLPGLFRAGNSDQSVEDAATVKNIVRQSMKRPRSIILVVVSAKSDFALQDVTELARELDPFGERTLGLITKPDTLDAGSDSETSYVKLAQNKDVVYQLGWHVLKNRSYEMRGASNAERDRAEEEFFAAGIWTSMSPQCLGVKTLKPRLTRVLTQQILLQLPSLLQDVRNEISDRRQQLQRLGFARTTPEEQRRYLLQVTQNFSTLIKSAVSGAYNDPFFTPPRTDTGYLRRLRAVVQNRLADFEEDMRMNGQTRVIDESDEEDMDWPRISRSEYIKDVMHLMRRSRGCELPGTFNPLIIGDLFIEQCQPWRLIATRTKDIIFESVCRSIQSVFAHVAVQETIDGIMRMMNRQLDTLKSDLDQKVDELMDPHYVLHPITYNHYLTDTVQKVQAERRNKKLERILKSSMGLESLKQNQVYSNVNPVTLLHALQQDLEPDMERHAADLAVDYMQAYYKVTMKRFVDDYSVLAIEQCLITQLPSLFTPDKVNSLNEDEVIRLASENDVTTAERSRCMEDLNILEAGLEDLRKLDSHWPIARGAHLVQIAGGNGNTQHEIMMSGTSPRDTPSTSNQELIMGEQNLNDIPAPASLPPEQISDGDLDGDWWSLSAPKKKSKKPKG